MARRKKHNQEGDQDVSYAEQEQVGEILDQVEDSMQSSPDQVLKAHQPKVANKDYNQHPKFQKFKKGVN